jgi:hypothetical protein
MGTTINLSEKTKERFEILKVKFQGYKEESFSADEFVNILLNRLEEENYWNTQ